MSNYSTYHCTNCSREIEPIISCPNCIVTDPSLEAKLQIARELIKDLLEELRPYAQPSRDTTKGPGWEWNYVEIKHEFDYEYYPNHVDKKVIEEFEKRFKAIEEILETK